MTLADDAGVLLVAGKLRVHRRRRRAQFAHEFVHARARHQRVVGRHASLAGVEQFAESQARRSLRQVAAFVDDGGRLAAQFQRHRCQVVRRGDSDLASYRGGAGKNEMVERQRRKIAADLNAAFDHGQLGRGEITRRQLRQQARKGRRQLAGFDHHAIARRQGGSRRHQRQLAGVVPRHDIADHTQRLRHDPARAGQHVQRRRHAARPHPAPQLAALLADGRQHDEQLRQHHFLPRAPAKVGIDRFQDGRFVVGHQRLQAVKPLAPDGGRRHHVGIEGRALHFQPVQQRWRAASYDGRVEFLNFHHSVSSCAAFYLTLS